MFFAGISVPQWTSVRKIRESLTTNDLYGFLITDPNNVDTWMSAPWEEARALARPLANDRIKLTALEPYGSTIVNKEGEPLLYPLVL